MRAEEDEEVLDNLRALWEGRVAKNKKSGGGRRSEEGREGNSS